MRRRMEKFEVKNEMYDGGKIRPDDSYKENGGKSSKAQQEEIFEDTQKVGFDDDFDIDEVDNITPEIDENTIQENKLQNLNEKDIKGIITGYVNVSASGEISAKHYIASEAKKIGVEKNELQAFVLEEGKKNIKSRDKVLHYHRTSMKSFEKIMETGSLLNRERMQAEGIDTSKLSGSSSQNVQFTRDIYDSDGKLARSGFGRENVGANSTDIVFVMGPELINEETYNCFMPYPTVEKADIQKCCVTILAKDPNIQKQVESILKEKDLTIKTILQDEFDREVVLEELEKANICKDVDKNDFNDKEKAIVENKEDEELEVKLNEKEERRALKDEARDIGEEEIYEQNDNKGKKPQITNLDIEQELGKYYDDTVDIVTLKAYLKEKIPQVYGDKLEKFGIDIDEYLENHKLSLEYFEGAESYKEIASELDSYLDALEEFKDDHIEKDNAENKETEELEAELNEKEERRALKDIGEEEIYEDFNKETDFILKSVNGRDMLTSAVEVTEVSTRESNIEKAADSLNKGLRARTQPEATKEMEIE